MRMTAIWFDLLMMIMMILFCFLIGLRLPPRQTAARLASATAWSLRPLSSFSISLHVLASLLNWRIWRQRQDMTKSVQEFHTIPRLWRHSHRIHQSLQLFCSGDQLWDHPASWEKFTPHWAARLKGSCIKTHLQCDFDGDCLHDCITTRHRRM